MNYLNYLLFAALLPVGLSCNPAREGESDTTAETPPLPPNIVYMLADDLGYGDLSCYGQEKFTTPNLDRLAQQGMQFLQHYAGSTVCAPSRSVLMTGRHTGHTFIRGNKEVQPEGQFPLPDSIVTLAEMMKDRGYVNGAFGKWGLGAPGSTGDPLNQGFDVFFGYNCQRYAHRYYPEHLWDNDQKLNLPNDGTQKIAYAPDLIQQRALQFIRQSSDTSFFLFLPYTLPHAELVVPEDSILENFRGKFLPEKAYEGNDYGPDFSEGGYASQAESHAVFAAMVTRLDRYAGEVISLLDSLGIRENTVVFFSSDNGPHLEGGADPDYFNSNGPLRGYKRDLYEGGIRVPFIVSWPGTIPSGAVSDHVCAFWDMMPTMLEISGQPAPTMRDGISFLPELKQLDQEDHAYLYWEFQSQGGKQAVRMGTWKGIRLGVNEDRDAPIALYNLETDPSESEDISPNHPGLVEEMDLLMQEAHSKSPVFNFDWESQSDNPSH